MDVKDILSEMGVGIKKTAQYILSHHESNEFYKCYFLKIKNTKLYLCSRCFGIYLGIVMGLAAIWFMFLESVWFLFIILAPIPALMDWTVTEFSNKKGYNVIRTITGFLLGIAYAIAVFLLITEFPSFKVLLVGLFYALTAVILLKLAKKI